MIASVFFGIVLVIGAPLTIGAALVAFCMFFGKMP